MQLFLDPYDQIVERFKRGTLRDLECYLQNIDHIQLERFILFTYKIKLDELITEIIPDFFEFGFQGCIPRMSPDLSADPKWCCQRRADVRDSSQAVYDTLRQFIAVASLHLYRVAVADVHSKYIAQSGMVASLFAVVVKFIVIIPVTCKYPI